MWAMARPRKPLLSRDRIVETASALVDAEGLAALSTRRLAAELGVSGPSLYNHFRTKDEILDAVADAVSAKIDLAMFDEDDGRDWRTALYDWARSYRAAFAAHPRAIPLLTTSPVRAPEVLLQYEQAVTLLLDAGFALPDVMPVIIGLENLVLGSALDMAAPEAMWELTDEAATPQLARALGAVDTRTDAAFELALTGYVAHLRTLLESP